MYIRKNFEVGSTNMFCWLDSHFMEKHKSNSTSRALIHSFLVADWLLQINRFWNIETTFFHSCAKNWNLLKCQCWLLNTYNFQAYTHPDQIDLYPAGLSETPLPGGILGPTFSQMVGDQFRALKDGDRFFFTHNYQSGGGVGYPTNIQVIFLCSGSLDIQWTDMQCKSAHQSKSKQKSLFCNVWQQKWGLTPKARQSKTWLGSRQSPH